jgi:pilus assembly protein CpaE
VRDFLRRPVSSTELQEVIDRNVATSGGPVRRGRANGRIISFVSNKGGVGKSTMSVSAACVLAKRHPGRVLLVDASLQLGVCASSLDFEPETTIVDAVHELGRLDETLLRQIAMKHRSGLHVLAAPNDAIEATHVGEAEISRILSVARRAFDFVVVDTFPLLDAVAVAILDLSQMVYVVTSGTVPNVIGMARFIDVIERIGVNRDRQRLILNHAQPRFAGSLTPQDVATRLDRDIDHVFPFDKKVLVSLNTGEPYALHAGTRFGYGKALKLLEADLESVAAPRALQVAPSRSTVTSPSPSTASMTTGEVRA